MTMRRTYSTINHDDASMSMTILTEMKKQGFELDEKNPEIIIVFLSPNTDYSQLSDSKKKILIIEATPITQFSEKQTNNTLKRDYFNIIAKNPGIHRVFIGEKQEPLEKQLHEIIFLNKSSKLMDFQIISEIHNNTLKVKIMPGNKLQSFDMNEFTYRFFLFRDGSVVYKTNRIKENSYIFELPGGGIYYVQGYVHHEDTFHFNKSNTIEYRTDAEKLVIEKTLPNKPFYEHMLMPVSSDKPFQDLIIHISRSSVNISKPASYLGLHTLYSIQSNNSVLMIFGQNSIATKDGMTMISGFSSIDNCIITEFDSTTVERLSDASPGCFVKVSAKNDFIDIIRDICGFGELFVYRYCDEIVISNHYYTLLHLIKASGLPLTVDYEKLKLVLSTGSQYVVTQNGSSCMDILEIEQISPRFSLRISDGQLSVVPTCIDKVLSEHPHPDYDDYLRALGDAAEEIRSNVLTAARFCNDLGVDLTGGLDSRVVFSALTNTDIEREKIHINSIGPDDSLDVMIATEINSVYRYPYNQKTIRRIVEDNFVSENWWRNQFMGRIYSTEYNMYVNDTLQTKLSGGTGDAFARPEFSRHLFNTIGEYCNTPEELANVVWEKQIINHVICSPKYIREKFISLMSNEIINSGTNSILEGFDLNYFFYRNGYHFNPEQEYIHGTLNWMPLQSLALFRLYHMTHDIFRNARLEIELINYMNPLLTSINFEAERENIDYAREARYMINDDLIAYHFNNDIEITREARSSAPVQFKAINAQRDPLSHEMYVCKLINRIAILTRLHEGILEPLSNGLISFVLKNIDNRGKLRTIYNKVTSAIDEIQIAEGHEQSMFLLGTDMIVYADAKQRFAEIKQLASKL